MGCAIGARCVSDSTPILQPQSDTKDHKTYVLFVFFVAKTNRSSFANHLRQGYGGHEATEDRKETNHDKD